MHTLEKETRVYTKEQVKFLPDIPSSHPYYNEWKVRKHSSEQLIWYLKKKGKALNILEVGCGNGWLAAKLSVIEHSTVTGLDINQTELNQAKAVFKKDNLHFVYDTLREGIFPGRQFDVVVFAACLPYFPRCLSWIRCSRCLASAGRSIFWTRLFTNPKILRAHGKG